MRSVLLWRGLKTVRTKRVKPLVSDAAPVVAAQKKRAGSRQKKKVVVEKSDVDEDEHLAIDRRPVTGAMLRDEELLEDAKMLGEFLDTEGTDEEFMEDIEVDRTVLELGDDAKEEEERFFRGFFGKKEPMISEEEMSELQRKLGADSTVSDPDEQDLREQEQDDPRENVILPGVRGNTVSDRPGFQRRGQRSEVEEQEDNEKKQRERQRRVHVVDDRLYVGDVVIPYNLEKWILDPEGDHKRRHRRQRQKEERLAKWYEEHGMYYTRRKQSGFKKDPVEQNLTVRQRRVGMMLKNALETVMERDLEHERVPGISIEDVQISVDMKKAKILWNSLDSDSEVNGFLHRMTPAIRYLVTQRVQLKYSPELLFIRTDYARKEEEVEKLASQMEAGKDEEGEEFEDDDDEEDEEAVFVDDDAIDEKRLKKD